MSYVQELGGSRGEQVPRVRPIAVCLISCCQSGACASRLVVALRRRENEYPAIMLDRFVAEECPRDGAALLVHSRMITLPEAIMEVDNCPWITIFL